VYADPARRTVRIVVEGCSMERGECEKAIRYFATNGPEFVASLDPPMDQPSFSDFKWWLSERGYSRYMDFRSFAGADYDAEIWFDQELKQTSRN
jgi:hypothetical protein